MKRWYVLVLLGSLAISTGWAQSATPQATAPDSAAAPASAANPENQIKGAMPVKLEKSLDSKKLKVGDTVVFETISAIHSRSGLMIPTGSKVIGHVTQAQARSKGDPDSTLGISFDKLVYSKGEDVPMKGTLQAVGPSLGGNGPTTGPAEPGTLSGKGGGGTTAPPTSGMQIGGPANGTPMLLPTSQGVLGVKNLQMDANGVLTSPGKEVRLDAGMQILIRAEIDLPSH